MWEKIEIASCYLEFTFTFSLGQSRTWSQLFRLPAVPFCPCWRHLSRLRIFLMNPTLEISIHLTHAQKFLFLISFGLLWSFLFLTWQFFSVLETWSTAFIFGQYLKPPKGFLRINLSRYINILLGRVGTDVVKSNIPVF